MTPQPNKPKGVFSASRISDLLASGGKARQSYIYDLCLDVLGLYKNFETKEMLHGTVNQQNAFDFTVKPLFKDAVMQHDVYISINKDCGASPDVLIGNDTLDIKCPTLLYFNAYRHSQPKSMKDQVQMQMMATKADKGYLLFYLSKPETWGEEGWEEYDFERYDDNHYVIEFAKDEAKHEEILKAVEKAAPQRDELLDILVNAEEWDFKTLMRWCRDGNKYDRLKNANNMWNADVFRYDNEFYFKTLKKQ